MAERRDTSNISGSTPVEALGRLFNMGQSGEMLAMQKHLLEAYAQASSAWVSRVKLEADLWSQLAGSIMASRSIPEALSAYQQCVAQRMQMAAEDGQRLTHDTQEFMAAISRAFSNGSEYRGARRGDGR